MQVKKKHVGIAIGLGVCLVCGVVVGVNAQKGIVGPKYAYQYDIVKESDYSYMGILRKPISGSTSFSTPVYNSSSIILTDGDEKVTVDLNYIKASEVVWAYDGKDYIPEGTEVDSLETNKFKGTIHYEDGKERSISVVAYTVADDNKTIYLSDGTNTYNWTPEIK